MMLRRLLVVGVVGVALGGILGCRTYTRAQPNFALLRYRAALDLHCRGDLALYDAGSRTQLVRGCGQEAVYIHDCLVASDRYSSWQTDCTWRLERQPGPIVGAR